MTIYYAAPSFDTSRVSHGFFGRQGGVSTGVYESLNAGYGTDDPRVGGNRDIIARVMGGVGRDDIASVHQVHSAECVVVTAPVPLDQRPRADAMVTDQLNVILGVLTADCGPILFRAVNKNGDPIIGAAHASATVAGAELSDTGYFIGAGMDYAISDKWSVGGELLQHQFDDFDDSGVDLDATTIKAKVALRF